MSHRQGNQMINFDYLWFVVLALSAFGCVSLVVMLVVFDIWRFIETRRNKNCGAANRVWVIYNPNGSSPSRPPTVIGGGTRGDRDAAVRDESGSGIKCYGAGEFPLQRATALADGLDLGRERVQCPNCERCGCNRSDAGDAA